MGNLKTSVFASAILLASGTAFAADLPPPPVLEPTMVMEPVELGTGWYLRGDVGYSMGDGPKTTYNNFAFNGGEVDSTFTFGAGAGYKFNNWFRADLTADYRYSRDYRATFADTAAGIVGDVRGKMNSTAVLANGYLDLGTWSGITPYVGAGIGFGWVEAGTMYTNSFAGVNCICLQAPGAPLGSLAYGKRNAMDVAWALMAGAAIDVSPGMKLDVGYRYLAMGNAETKVDAAGQPLKFKDYRAHEFRVGVRYFID